MNISKYFSSVKWDSSKLALYFAALSFIITVVLLMVYVPMHMDELNPFHRLACYFYPNSKYHIFRESYESYGFSLFGVLNYYHSYPYIGPLQCVLGYPFFLIFTNYFGIYLFGIVSLLIFCYLMVAVLKTKKYIAIIPALYYPILFLDIHDEGPVRLSFILFPIVILLISSVLNENKKLIEIIPLTILLSIVCIIGTIDKAFFVYTLPMYFILGFTFKFNLNESISFDALRSVSKQSYIRYFTISLFCIFVIFIYFYFSKIRIGSEWISYFSYLVDQSKFLQKSLQYQLSNIFIYLTNPLIQSDKSYSYTALSLLISQTLFIPLLFVGIKYVIKNRMYCSGLFISFVVQILIVLIMRNCAYAHHYVFLHLPILIGMMIWADRSNKAFVFISSSLAITAVVTTLLMINSPQYIHSEIGRENIFSYLKNHEIGKNSVINISDWGCYYNQSLFGDKEQIVTYIEPLTTELSQLLIYQAKKAKRNYILNVSYKISQKNLEKYFIGCRVEEIPISGTHWHIHKITWN